MKQKNDVTVSVTPVFQTMYNYQRELGRIFDMPSLTVPDHTMSLVEIIDKFTTGGMAQNLGQKLWYDGEGDDVLITDDILLGRHWDSFDIDEKHEIIKKADNDFRRLNEGIALQQKDKADKLAAKRKQDAEDMAEFKAWSKKQKEVSE